MNNNTINAVRDYQQNACNRVINLWNAGKRSVLVVSPTSSGKTRIAVEICRQCNKRVLWLAHRRELVKQAVKTLMQNGVASSDIRVLMSDYRDFNNNSNAQFTVASIQTVLARDVALEADVIVFDEAHHILARTYRALVALFPHANVVGLTATPERADGKSLGDVFEELVEAVKNSELRERGLVVPTQTLRPNVDLESNQSAWDILEALKYTQGRKTIAFFGSVEAARTAARRINTTHGAGTAVCILATTPHADRADAQRRFQDITSNPRVLCTVDVLTEGVDLPEAQAVISDRNFSSRTAMIQAFGRVGRLAAGKELGTIIDLRGSTRRFGLPDVDHDWRFPAVTAEEEQESTTSGSQPEGRGGPEESSEEPEETTQIEVVNCGMEVVVAKGVRPDVVFKDFPVIDYPTLTYSRRRKRAPGLDDEGMEAMFRKMRLNSSDPSG